MSPTQVRRPLRVLMATPVYAPCIGGGERLLQVVAEQLVGRGHTVTVVTLNAASQPDMLLDAGANLPAEEVLNGVRIHRVAPGGGRTDQALRWWLRRRGGWRSMHLMLGNDATWLLGPPSAAAMLPRLLSTSADVLVAANWGFSASMAADLAARIRRLPVVGLPLFHIVRPWAGHQRFRPMLERCSAVIALTAAEGEFVRERGARRVEVIGCGVDPARFASASADVARARLDLGDRPVVGFFGRQDTLKGVPTLIDAMRLVWREAPEAILLLAGQSAHRDRETDDRIGQLNPSERARLRVVDDFTHGEAPDLFAACDIVVLPSVEEAFGFVFLEAWMVRRPVVGVRIPSTECVIHEGKDGLIVNPMDPVHLSHAIVRLLRNPDERRAMGACGHGKVMSLFTLEGITDQWEEVLLSTARRRGA